MRERYWIETLDGRLLDQAMFSAYNIVQRQMDGDLEIVGYRHTQKKKGCNLATIQSETKAYAVYDKFKACIREGDINICMKTLLETC